MHLVGFIIRVYNDARSSECQEKYFFLHSLFLRNLFLFESQISFGSAATKQECCIEINHSQSEEIWRSQVRIE